MNILEIITTYVETQVSADTEMNLSFETSLQEFEEFGFDLIKTCTVCGCYFECSQNKYNAQVKIQIIHYAKKWAS